MAGRWVNCAGSWPLHAYSGGQVQAVGHVEIGRLYGCWPRQAGAVHPGRGQSCRTSRFNIQRRSIANIEALGRLESALLRQPLETASIGLGSSDATRIQRNAEKLRDADPPEIGIAVAQRCQGITGAEARQSRAHIGKQIQLIALGNKNLERLLGDALVITTLARVLRKRSNSKIGEVMCVVRLALCQGQARGPQVIE